MKTAIIKIDWQDEKADIVSVFQGDDAGELAEASVVGFRKLAAHEPRFDFLIAAQQLDVVVPST